MSLVSLELSNIRIYKHTRLVPDQHLNIISGANASGKTTLLEAIHLLGTGRSFRTTQIEQLQRYGSANLSVLGQVRMDSHGLFRLGLSCTMDGKRASINGLEQRQVSSLAQHLPLQSISPDAHYEFQQNTKHRRGALDWCLFHVEHDFPKLWGRYQRILQQRNASLKLSGQARIQHAWDDELVEAGEKINTGRADLIGRLLPHFQSCCRELFGGNLSVGLALETGWEGANGFAEALEQDRVRDRARGFTHSGPQRADLQIYLNSRAGKESASHGQYKLLVIALRLAQIQYLIEANGRHCCLLIDDLAAELDEEHRARLIQVLARLPVQLFVTATKPALIDHSYWPSYKMFHVKHGTVSESA